MVVLLFGFLLGVLTLLLCLEGDFTPTLRGDEESLLDEYNMVLLLLFLSFSISFVDALLWLFGVPVIEVLLLLLLLCDEEGGDDAEALDPVVCVDRVRTGEIDDITFLCVLLLDTSDPSSLDLDLDVANPKKDDIFRTVYGVLM